MTTRAMPAEEFTDEELVAQSLAGNRNAFGEIVRRYQTLICSVAYSAARQLDPERGFVAGNLCPPPVKQLTELRERGKLRSWLCGIR